MKLPIIKIKLAPDGQCIRCGQHGYVGDKNRLCLGCLNIALLEYAKWKRSFEMPDFIPPKGFGLDFINKSHEKVDNRKRSQEK
jgi:hypothetical protein